MQCFENLTTGGQSIQIIGASGTGVTIANGTYACVQGDGTNYVTGAGGSSGVKGCFPVGWQMSFLCVWLAICVGFVLWAWWAGSKRVQ